MSNLRVVVKPLDWREVHSPREDGPPEPTGDFEANTPIGLYSVDFDSDEDMAHAPWCCWAPDENLGHFEDRADALFAAFVDYEKRILAAIEVVQ